jgi:hypothetical protein
LEYVGVTETEPLAEPLEETDTVTEPVGLTDELSEFVTEPLAQLDTDGEALDETLSLTVCEYVGVTETESLREPLGDPDIVDELVEDDELEALADVVAEFVTEPLGQLKADDDIEDERLTVSLREYVAVTDVDALKEALDEPVEEAVAEAEAVPLEEPEEEEEAVSVPLLVCVLEELVQGDGEPDGLMLALSLSEEEEDFESDKLDVPVVEGDWDDERDSEPEEQWDAEGEDEALLDRLVDTEFEPVTLPVLETLEEVDLDRVCVTLLEGDLEERADALSERVEDAQAETDFDLVRETVTLSDEVLESLGEVEPDVLKELDKDAVKLGLPEVNADVELETEVDVDAEFVGVEDTETVTDADAEEVTDGLRDWDADPVPESLVENEDVTDVLALDERLREVDAVADKDADEQAESLGDSEGVLDGLSVADEDGD